MNHAIAAAMLILLAGCQPAADDASVSSDDPVPAPAPFAPAPDCPIIDSGEWAAWVDAMPGPNNQPRLMISGKVRVPTSGYRAQFSNMRVAESYPVQIFLDLTVTPPSGPATQAITTIDIRGEWPIAPPVGSITIRCGRQVIGRIDEIVTAL
jgi:hypothetical protein